jgi:hypothetical protein
MGDFCNWATAACAAYGWKEDEFMLVYTENVNPTWILLSHLNSLQLLFQCLTITLNQG